jgi:hypothetical protein
MKKAIAILVGILAYSFTLFTVAADSENGKVQYKRALYYDNRGNYYDAVRLGSRALEDGYKGKNVRYFMNKVSRQLIAEAKEERDQRNIYAAEKYYSLLCCTYGVPKNVTQQAKQELEKMYMSLAETSYLNSIDENWQQTDLYELHQAIVWLDKAMNLNDKNSQSEILMEAASFDLYKLAAAQEDFSVRNDYFEKLSSLEHVPKKVKKSVKQAKPMEEIESYFNKRQKEWLSTVHQLRYEKVTYDYNITHVDEGTLSFTVSDENIIRNEESNKKLFKCLESQIASRFPELQENIRYLYFRYYNPEFQKWSYVSYDRLTNEYIDFSGSKN